MSDGSVVKDYYQTLGVDPLAGPAEIRDAYRRAAMRDHPDRPGGAHERMVELAEAWETLRDPVRRAAYDRARARPADPAAQGQWRAIEPGVRRDAASYPQSWASFDDLLESFRRDAAGARYGETGFAFLNLPTVTGSVSGSAMVFWGAAACLGLAIGLWPSYRHAFIGLFTLETFRNGPYVFGQHLSRGPMGIAFMLWPIIGGAWGGRYVHEALRDLAVARHARNRQRATKASPPPGPPEVIACPACGRKLRVPRRSGTETLRVTCPTCRAAFDHVAASATAAPGG